ncbi:MAG: TetR/AcrR family transcriptional regulator [Myxococcus sp.]|nr:TetR/AcrR family transcriptional regulator [Myxococcus sp.]
MKTEQKRRAILDASARVFSKHGFHASTVAQIAEDEGIGLGTFYRYFDSKLDVFHAVIDEVMAEVAVVLAPESASASTTLDEYRAQVERIGRGLFDAFQQNRALARLLFVEAPGISQELNEKLKATVTFFGIATQAYLENGITRGFLRKDLDVEVTALLVNSMVFEGVRQLAANEAPAELARWTKAITALMFEGVRA